MLDVNELSKAELGDIASNPKRYGLPTLEEFVADPEKYRAAISYNELMAQIDKGSQMLNRHVTGHEYYVGGYRVKSLEAAEKLLGEMGLKVSTKMMKPQIIDQGAGKCTIRITFQIPGDDDAN